MENSPLTQQVRPDVFQPKIAYLYGELFKEHSEEDLTQSEGFWREFFLLKPDRDRLRARLEGLDTGQLLHIQHETQQLFVRAVRQLTTGAAPADEIVLDTLTVFLGCILAKRYTNPSSDIISILTGLDNIDTAFTDFAAAIESIIRAGRSLDVRRKAVEVALALTSGAHQTSLVSYFTHRDLFPSIVKYIQDCDDPSQSFHAFLLLGLLANYNKFEFRNPYRLRLEDFVNESVIWKIVRGFGQTCRQLRENYVQIQEDLPEGWNFSNALSYIGLGALAPSKSVAPIAASADKEAFASLPGPQAAIFLSIYDFANANKLFCSNLMALSDDLQHREGSLSTFLSLTSYTLHHAHRSSRAALYSLLNLTTLRILVEDVVLCRRICGEENKIFVRLCRQRQPYLPLVSSERAIAANILDIAVDGINHNLRRNLDLDIYVACLGLVRRLLSYISATRTKLVYHWPLLWQTLLSLLRFLATYATDLARQNPNIDVLVNELVNTLALAASFSEAFLPNPAEYDDLLYKLIETGDLLTTCKDAYQSQSRSQAVGGATSLAPTPIDALIAISRHYHSLIEEQKAAGKLSKNASPREVNKIIRQGYESLSIPEVHGLMKWEFYREGENKVMLKRVARAAVEDARKLL